MIYYRNQKEKIERLTDMSGNTIGEYKSNNSAVLNAAKTPNHVIRGVSLLLFCFFICNISPERANAVASSIPIYINNTLAISDVPPFIEDGVTMVPIRVIASELGASVDWQSPRVLINDGGREIILTIGNNTAVVNNADVLLSRSAEIRNGRTFVPLRFVAESLGASVNYSMGQIYIWSETPARLNHGNIQNGGRVVEDDTTVYWAVNGQLFRMDKASGDARQIDLLEEELPGWGKDWFRHPYIRDIGVSDGYLYCFSYTEILKIDPMTGGVMVVADVSHIVGIEGGPSQLQIYGDYIYCQYDCGKYFFIVKISIEDGSGKSIQTDSLPSSFSIEGDYIYAALGYAVHDPGILKMPLNGRTSSSERFFQGIAYGQLVIHNDKVYFTVGDWGSGFQLQRINKDGSDLETVFDVSICTYNISGNTLYYSLYDKTIETVDTDGSISHSSVAGDLYKMDLLSNEVTKIAEGHIAEIYVLENGVYYIDRDYPQNQQTFNMSFTDEIEIYLSDQS